MSRIRWEFIALGWRPLARFDIFGLERHVAAAVQVGIDPKMPLQVIPLDDQLQQSNVDYKSTDA